jgi:nucleotide-binding universal stress UspA family protein
MHLTVGYLATPTGDDRHPGRAEYQQLLIRKGEEWIAQAISALSAAGVSANANVLVGESYAESLIAFAEEKDSDLIVIGGRATESSAATSSPR